MPKRVRERLRLHCGDKLPIEIKGDAIQLTPKQTKARLQRVNGVLVFVTGEPVPEESDLVAKSREERIDQIARGVTEHE